MQLHGLRRARNEVPRGQRCSPWGEGHKPSTNDGVGRERSRKTKVVNQRPCGLHYYYYYCCYYYYYH